MISLAGKVALVTGGGAGIGLAIVEAFAELGARVAVVDIDSARATSTRDRLAAGGKEALAIGADVTKHDQVQSIVPEIDRAFGRLDIVVNNVGSGLGWRKPFMETAEHEWDALYAVNLRHMFSVCREAIPLMRRGRQGGSIINISTIEAFRAIPVMTVYCAFKTAITGFTRSLALELAPDEIRVNAIAPETTQSATFDVPSRVHPQHMDQIRNWIPLGRFGEAPDAAGCAVFLATDLSRWVTGTTVNLDGGALAAAGWVRTPSGSWTHRPVVAGSGYREP